MAITTRHPLAGCQCVWHDTLTDLSTQTWLKASQAWFAWDEVEPTEGNYNWTLFDNRINNRLCGLSTTRLYLQVNARWPNWIYNYIAKATFTNGRGDYPPQFWDPLYLTYYEGFIAALAAHVAAASYADQIYMVRAQYNAYNPESINPVGHWPYTDYTPTGGGHRYNVDYSIAQGNQYAKDVIQAYQDEFSPHGILVCGKSFGHEWGYDISDYVVDTIGAHFFQTNETPNSLYRINMLRQCKTDKEARGFSEPNNWSGHWPAVPRIQVIWWSALTCLHQGMEWVSFYETDAVNYAMFSDTFDFVNTYAGYLYTPAVSPGAWIAFSGVPPRFWKDLEGSREFLISILNEGSHTALFHYTAAQFDDSALNPFDVGTTGLGPSTQPYGIWALAIAADPIELELNNDFVNSLAGDIILRVIFRNDNAGGSVYIRYKDAGGTTQTITHTMANTGTWVSYDTTVSSYRFQGELTGGADIELDSDVAAKFHFLEVIRLEPPATEEPEEPVSISYGGAAMGGSMIMLKDHDGERVAMFSGTGRGPGA